MPNQHKPSKWSQDANLTEKIQEALRKCGGGSTAAAELLGMSSMTFYRYCSKLGIRKRRPGGRGTSCMKPSVPLQDILSGASPCGSTVLLHKLFKEDLKQELCEECGIGSTWNNRRLTLQLHHKNGDHKNNGLENLQVLCPNCHTQTNNWGGRRCRINNLDDETLRQQLLIANQNGKTLHCAASTMGISASHFRKLLIKFEL